MTLLRQSIETDANFSSWTGSGNRHPFGQLNRPAMGGEDLLMDHDPRSLRRDFARWSEEQRAAKVPFAPVYRPHADRLLSDSELSRTAKLAYFWLLVHNSRKTGEERWTVAQIAEGIALRERAVQSALAELELSGWLFRYQFGANKAYNYFIVPPDQVGPGDAAAPAMEEETSNDE